MAVSSLESSHTILLPDFPGGGVSALSLAFKYNDFMFWARFPFLVSFDGIFLCVCARADNDQEGFGFFFFLGGVLF